MLDKPKAGTPEYRKWYYNIKYKTINKSKKDEFAKRNKNYIIRLKQKFCCIKCGLKKWYLIEFHHLNPSNKYKSITDLQFNAYSIKTIKEEIRKCVPICRNCHMEFHHLERNRIIDNFTDYLNLKI